MKRFFWLLGPPLWSASLLALALPAPASSSPSTVGAIPGVHGPPRAAWLGEGSAIVVAYVLREGKDADLFAWRVGDTPATSTWPEDGVAVCSASGDQTDAAVTGDGSGGAFIAWIDRRNRARPSIYAQHLLAAGALDPTWPADGLPVQAGSGSLSGLRAVADGAGGVYLGWETARDDAEEVVLHHLLGSGSLDSRWPARGLRLSRSGALQSSPALVSDGATGAIVGWIERNQDSPTSLVRVARVHSDGQLDPSFAEATFGSPEESVERGDPVLASSDAGGAFVTWLERVAGGRSQVRIGKVSESGSLEAWPAGGLVVSASKGSQRQQDLLPDGRGGAFVAWQDSRSEGQEAVFLQHVTASGAIDSEWPEGGLAASSKKGLQVRPRIASVGGNLLLTWLDRTSPGDVRPYAQHVLAAGRVDPEWPPGGALLSLHPVDDIDLIAESADRARGIWRDAASWTMRQTALTAEVPSLEAEETTPRVTALMNPRPNPSMGAVFIRFSLATRLHARIDIFDIQGRRLATPLDRLLDPGPHELQWDRKDGGGNRAKSGMYFIRLDTGEQRFTRRFVLIR